MGQMMRSVAPTTEWIAFASRSEYLLDPDTPLRNPMTINYPGKDDPSVIEVHSGILERKKRFTKTYRESYYVLTPSGWMHQLYVASPSRFGSPAAARPPTRPSIPTPSSRSSSPSARLAPPPRPTPARTSSTSRARRALAATWARRTASLRATSTLPSARARTTRCSSGGTTASSSAKCTVRHALSLCEPRLTFSVTSSEPFDRSGPVPAAVRAAGYVSEEEEETDEEGGSSVEEETDEEDEEEHDVSYR